MGTLEIDKKLCGVRLVDRLLTGLVIVLVVALLTKNSRPIFWRIIIGVNMVIGIGREASGLARGLPTWWSRFFIRRPDRLQLAFISSDF